jgi:hypothetical protein
VRVVAGVVLVVVAVVAVNFVYQRYINPDRLAGKGTPVSAPPPVRPVPPPTPPPNQFTNPQPVRQIVYDLENRVLKMTGVAERVQGHCDDDDFTGEAAATFTCTVTYREHQVRYTVNAKPSGTRIFQYTARPQQGLIVRDGILALVWNQYHQTTSSLRCDDIPAIAQVPVNTPLPFRCYAKLEQGSGSGNRTALVTITVLSTDITDSILLRTEPQ